MQPLIAVQVPRQRAQEDNIHLVHSCESCSHSLSWISNINHEIDPSSSHWTLRSAVTVEPTNDMIFPTRPPQHWMVDPHPFWMFFISPWEGPGKKLVTLFIRTIRVKYGRAQLSTHIHHSPRPISPTSHTQKRIGIMNNRIPLLWRGVLTFKKTL